MKVVIAGGRDIEVSDEQIKEAIEKSGFQVTEIVSGGARGVDTCANRYADNCQLKFTLFKAEWDKFKGLAGPKRNLQMAMYGDALILFWDGKSKGSGNMKARMVGLKKPVYEVII